MSDNRIKIGVRKSDWEMMKRYSFRLKEEILREYEELCKKIGTRPRSYLRIIVERETSRLKENL